MKKASLVLAVVIACSVVGFAGSCPTTTYDQYLGNGFSCTIGDTTWSNFGYTGTSNPPGFQIPAGGVGVTPQTGSNPGLMFSAGWLASTSTGVLTQDSYFTFEISSSTPLTDLTLAIAGASFIGTGEVIAAEQACLGGTFANGVCSSGNVVSLTVFTDAAGTQLSDTANFAGVSEIGIEKDLTVAAGTNGEATVSGLYNAVSEGSSSVPEPGTLSMLGLGGVALIGFARRKLNL
jgi:PEP-CTERM motif